MLYPLQYSYRMQISGLIELFPFLLLYPPNFSCLDLTETIHITIETTPAYRNPLAMPPSNILRPYLRTVQLRDHPKLMMGTKSRQICQQRKMPMQSIMTSKTTKQAMLPSMIIWMVSSQEVENQLKREYQNRPNSRLHSKVKAVASSRMVRECRVNFLQGAFMRVQVSRNSILVPRKQEEVVQARVVRANPPMKVRMRNWMITKTIANILSYSGIWTSN